MGFNPREKESDINGFGKKKVTHGEKIKHTTPKTRRGFKGGDGSDGSDKPKPRCLASEVTKERPRGEGRRRKTI